MKKIYILLIPLLLMSGCSTNNTISQSTDSSSAESISEITTTELTPENSSTEITEVATDETNYKETSSEITTSSEEENSSKTVSTETATLAENNSTTSSSADIYIGNYYDTSEHESTMTISKHNDGSYYIEIIRFRLTSLECTGTLTDAGIEFTENNSPTDMKGIITINDNLVTVTFTSSTWDYIKPNDSFQYQKQD